MAKSLFWLSDEAWKALSPHLPRGRPGKPRVDDRTVISGILHVLKTGCRWRDSSRPKSMGRRQRSTTATIAGLSVASGSASSRKMAAAAPFQTSFPSTAATSKLHRSASELKKGEFEEAIGRSRGRKGQEQDPCFGTTIAADRSLSPADPGNVADVVMAIPLLGVNPQKPKRVLTDKAYDADSLRRWLKRRKIRAAIPSTASRRTPYPLGDRAAPISAGKTSSNAPVLQAEELAKRVATRYDRLARNYLSGLALAAIIIAWT